MDEFKLSYTGAEINARLRKIEENSEAIENKANKTDLEALQELVGETPISEQINIAITSKADKEDIPTIDAEISAESENPVQNKVVKEYVDSLIPEIPTDEEVLCMLAESNIIDIVTDDNGDIFTDLNEDIIVF